MRKDTGAGFKVKILKKIRELNERGKLLEAYYLYKTYLLEEDQKNK